LSLPSSTPGSVESGASITELIADGRVVGHALRRLVSGDLAGLFDGPSTVSFDPSLPMVSLDLSPIQGSDQLIAMVMTCASAWMEAAISGPDGSQRWVIYDEAWRLVRQPALLARMQSQWKLSRALGMALVAGVQCSPAASLSARLSSWCSAWQAHTHSSSRDPRWWTTCA
jgi:type IV secretory pathway VirB4 component